MNTLKRLPIILSVIFFLSLGVLKIVGLIQNGFSIVGLLVSLNTMLFGYFLLHRQPGVSSYPWYIEVIIIASAFLGSFYKFDQPIPWPGSFLSSAGALLSIWALFALGKSFGISPVDRGLVMHGPYQYIRHPIYTGYLITTLPTLIWDPIAWNVALYVIIAVTFVIRILLEERVVSEYDKYANKVRWRILPFIW